MTDERSEFHCPACGFVSHNPNDAKHRYCVRCHRFFDAEIGRPLRANELRQIVVIAPPDRPGVFMTLWVKEVRDNLIVFFAGDMNWHVVNLVRDNGEIIDDQGRVVRVFEYLGEP